MIAPLLARRKRQTWRDGDMMQAVPRPLVKCEFDAEGLVVLLVPRFRDPILGRWLQPRLKGARRFVRIPLEARGSILWQAMDGHRTVAELCARLVFERPEDAEDIHTRVSMYLYRHYEQRFIEII